MSTSNLFLACAIAAVGLAARASAQEHVPAVPPPSAAPGSAAPGTPPPPAVEQPAQPPSTQPPSTQPPATQPPSTQPPATQPPAVQPPAVQPPSTQPPVAAPTEAPPVQLETPVPAACVPHCRSGYTCVNGTCVSSCNPPCGIGDVCTGQGECIPRPPAFPPPPPPSVPPPPPLAGGPRPSGAETHDGFFLRFTTGLAGGAVSLDIPDRDEVTFSGGGWSTSIDVGGAPTRDLVIFGRVRGSWIFDPKVRVGDRRADASDDLVVSQSLLGAGINYYLMPINIYFGGAIGFSTITSTWDRGGNLGDAHQDSDVGFGIDLDAGKEWWVSNNWGLGVALRLSLASVPAGSEEPQDAVYGSGFVTLLFSATYQ